MDHNLTVLFVPIDAVGHVNACVGIAEVLIQAGHRVVFVVSDQWRGRLTKYGIQEILLTEEGRDGSVDPGREWAERFVSDGVIKKGATALDNMINVMQNTMPYLFERQVLLDKKLESLLPTIKPDVMFLDQLIELPSVLKSKIPWVLVNSCNPLYHFYSDELPPAISGLAAIGVKSEWKAFRDEANRVKAGIRDDFNRYLLDNGCEPIDYKDMTFFINHSKYLNIYSYPLELDYHDMKPLPPKWHRFDNLKRQEKHVIFELPMKLRDRPGKLIYFSLGSMGAADVDNMKRLVNILSKSKHRFIVSKGPLHNKFKLADNMWGEGSVPQIQVLPLVDLVITHGGNNTVTETMYFGKPMIVLPLLGDQWDNAQRVEDKGFGIRLDAYKCSEEELLNAIQSLLNNKELNEMLLKISQRIQLDNSIASLPEMIEKLVAKMDINNN